jgi:hypothetical protein
MEKIMGMKTISNKFYFEQSTASTTWTITHNLQTNMPCVDFWVMDGGTYTKIMPSSMIVSNANTLVATFSSAQAGRATVV